MYRMYVKMSSRGCVRSSKSKGGNHIIRGGSVPLLINPLIKTEPVPMEGGAISGANKPVGIISPAPSNPLGGSVRHHREGLLNSLPIFGKHKGENKRDNIKFIF